MRVAILLVSLAILAGLIGYMVHSVKRATRAARRWATGERPEAPPPLRGRVIDLDESVARMRILRPRETARLTSLLDEVRSDARHAEGGKWEIEGQVMANVVDPVLRMLEALRPVDGLPREIMEALEAATRRIAMLRDQSRDQRLAVASGEARQILDSLRTQP